MKMYTKDKGWQGAIAFVANDREDALKVLRQIRENDEEEGTPRYKWVKEKVCFVSIQTIRSIEPIPNTSLSVCKFVNNSSQIVTADVYEVGQKVAFFPENIVHEGVCIGRKRLQKVWSDGIIQPCATMLSDNSDVSFLFNAVPKYGDGVISKQVEYSDEDYLSTWREYDVESGLIVQFVGDC
jgi:hypothetical protein